MDRLVGDLDLVVLLVALADAVRMSIASSTVGSSTMHRLEAALERGVLLDVLAVLVERRGADALQLAAARAAA